MNLRHATGRAAGNVLILSVVTIGILGITLAGYLALARTHTSLTARSQAWNLAIPLAEAGIEEAMTHLSFSGTNGLGNYGWSYSNRRYSLTRTLGDGHYTVSISNANPISIVSTGYMRLPLSTNYVERVIRATATNTNGPWVGALLALKRIDLSKASRVDSFDSSNPLFSKAGRYDAKKSKDGALVGSSYRQHEDSHHRHDHKHTAIRIREKSQIYGSVAVSPSGKVSIHKDAAVGSSAWVNAKKKGIESGHLFTDANYDFTPVSPPFTGGALTPSSGKVGNTNYQYVLGGGNYQLSSLDMRKESHDDDDDKRKGSSKDAKAANSAKASGMIVTGDAVLYVTGRVRVETDIYLRPGATLKLFVGGKTASFSKGEINSSTASQFQYFGLPTNKEIKIRKNEEFVGAIYAPGAKVKVSNGKDFVGAIIGKSIRVKGDGDVHYDEALKATGAQFLGYRVLTWVEQ